MLRRLVPRVALAATLVTAASACRDDTVRLAYRPDEGDRARYEITVRTESLVALPGTSPHREVDEVTLVAEHLVLSGADGDDGVRVRVRLWEQDAGPDHARSFVVRMNRSAQLAEVQEVEGLPASVLGDLGLAEIFPAAAGATPDHPVEPGEAWTIDEAVDLPGEQTGRLRGRGRLAAIELEDGEAVGVVETSTTLPVERTSTTGEGGFALSGTQHTDTWTVRLLEDGSVVESDATTTGRYRLAVAGADGQSVEGKLEVRIESETRRIG